jgi:TonB family protein
MFETTPRTMIGSSQGRYNTASQQPRRLLLALLLLLVALIALLIKDRQFWFGSEQATIESDMPQTATSAQTPGTTAARKTQSASTNSKKQARVVASAESQTENAPLSVTRTVLPPLDVEVVAGDKHHNVHPPANSTHVELQNPTEKFAAATNAAEREPLPPTPAAQPQASINASYPLLAQHMNVQGSVILQAIISAEGIVEDLRVLSGPAILTVAAQQAVREWRFKPVLQNGQAVETKAKITVNFSIKIADNSASTTLAESRASDILIVSR